MRKLFAGLALYAGLTMKSIAQTPYFIANAETKIPTYVSLDIARDMFMAKRVYLDSGVRVQVILLNRDYPSTRRFLLETLKVSPSAYFDKIDAMVASGKINVPMEVESEIRMLSLIRGTPGGIGFGSKDIAEDLLLKVIFIK